PLARAAVRQRGDLTGAYRLLTGAGGMSGQAEVATAALQEPRRAQPNISLAWIANQLPWKLDADREHYLEAFRRAGLDYRRFCLRGDLLWIRSLPFGGALAWLARAKATGWAASGAIESRHGSHRHCKQDLQSRLAARSDRAQPARY